MNHLGDRFVVLEYLAGSPHQRIEHYANYARLGLLALTVVSAVTGARPTRGVPGTRDEGL